MHSRMAVRGSESYAMPIGMRSRIRSSLYDQFSTRWVISSSFGIRCSMPSRVITEV